MNTNCLICTVGGSPAPLIHSLQYHNPEWVLFFASQESFVAIEQEILPACSFIKNYELIVLSAEQQLAICLKEMQEAITLFRQKAENKVIWGDFTGGTKVMSVALALSLQPLHIPLSYVGGTKRLKNGLGAVEDGQEKIMLYEPA